eukprot:357202-Chlamydomonas_euryale.AAC.21
MLAGRRLRGSPEMCAGAACAEPPALLPRAVHGAPYACAQSPPIFQGRSLGSLAPPPSSCHLACRPAHGCGEGPQ